MKAITDDNIRSGFARCGQPCVPKAQVLSVSARYANTATRHCFAQLKTGEEVDDDILLAFCAVPFSLQEGNFLHLLLSSSALGSRQIGRECDFCGTGWKRKISLLMSKRSGFLWTRSLPDESDVDEFVKRVANFDPHGTGYSLKRPVRLALACLPKVPFYIFYQVISP